MTGCDSWHYVLLHLHLQVMPVGYGYISFEADCEVTCEDTKIVFYSGMTTNRLFE